MAVPRVREVVCAGDELINFGCLGGSVLSEVLERHGGRRESWGEGAITVTEPGPCGGNSFPRSCRPKNRQWNLEFKIRWCLSHLQTRSFNLTLYLLLVWVGLTLVRDELMKNGGNSSRHDGKQKGDPARYSNFTVPTSTNRNYIAQHAVLH